MIGTLTNQKGGVGKTTNTIHLGSALAEKGYKVLLIDMDSQCNLSQGLGVNCNDEDYNIINLLEKKGNIQLKSKANNLFLIKGSINFNSKKYKIDSLKKALNDKYYNLVDFFDVILIDCPPANISLEDNQTIFSETEIALYASDFFLIPLKADYYSVFNANIFLGKVFELINRNNLSINFVGFFFCSVLITENSYSKYQDLLKEKAKDLLLDSFIRQDSNIKRAVELGKTIFQHKPNCRASEDYMDLTNEFIKKLKLN
ncbi:ParA family protein [Tenacibaculum finnmarkense]|uniref:ParA family protein n=1 Tax=Tenacibaculum finnmarkense TaxID=2781243 RepID=UPI001EFBFAAA|nr:ParA family protein [Tenacibaculum finnmarkense]MCG8739888.1 ParA family protein [Tenacibaculum finnmarkense]